MKSHAPEITNEDAATIVRLADVSDELDARHRARAFAQPLLQGELLDTGEDALGHADGVAAILHDIGASPAMQAAAYLVYSADFLQRPEEVIAKAFGASYAGLVIHTNKLVQIQRAAREARLAVADRAVQTERVRKMLLAFSRDLRVVLLRLASRLQTLRWYAATKRACPRALAEESMQVFAPLANRLGIWQIKWELEDLSFRSLEPEAYRQVAQLLDEKRVEREQGVEAFRMELGDELAAAGLKAEVQVDCGTGRQRSQILPSSLSGTSLIALIIPLLAPVPFPDCLPGLQPPPGHHLASAGVIQAVGIFALSATAHSTLPALRTA